MNESDIRLRIEAGRSLYLTAYLCLVHGLAAVAVWVVPLAPMVRPLLTVAAGASLVQCICVHGWKCARRSIVAAEYAEKQGWTLETRAGIRMAVRLLPSSYCSLSLVVLNFRAGRVDFRSLVLAPDSTAPEALRKLRVQLRRHQSAPP